MSSQPPSTLVGFHPAVRRWFLKNFNEPSPPQALGWPPIRAGRHTLILAPTGSGKTLAAMLECLNRLYLEGVSAEPEGVSILYISPLKALNNDIQRNLVWPLRGITHAAGELGCPVPEIRTAVRTGDTPPRERQAMLRRPPHVLITTPESLYLLLTGPRSKQILRTVRYVIVDEIHAMAGEKRGVHLAVSLERLAEVAGEFVRIGLSATQRPLDEIARFLGGMIEDDSPEAGEMKPRPVTVVDAGMRKEMDLRVVCPTSFHNPDGSVWPAVHQRLVEWIRAHRSTIVFVNGRGLAERLTAHLDELARAQGIVPEDQDWVRAHHGSLSRAHREEVESQLKEGRLAAVVATSSLELGIDIGFVDLVVQVESPKSVSRGLQRVGRSGHLLSAASKGRVVPQYDGDLLEAAVISGRMLEADVESTKAPQNCLDVLAQQLVAMASAGERRVDDVFRLVRRAYPYHRLDRDDLVAVLRMLGGHEGPARGNAAGRDREGRRLRTTSSGKSVADQIRPRLFFDEAAGEIRPHPGSRLIATAGGGTIPDRGYFGVYILPDPVSGGATAQPGRFQLGELDEEFVFETRVGDVFRMGNGAWRVESIERDRVLVSSAPGEIGRRPFWKGEGLGRPYELGCAVGRFLRELDTHLEELARDSSETYQNAVEAPLDTSQNAPGDPWATSQSTVEAPSKPPRQAPRLRLVRQLEARSALDTQAAANLLDYVERQKQATGMLPSDRCLVLERFVDRLGDTYLVLHSQFGGRVNAAWALALQAVCYEALGVEPKVLHDDAGIAIKLPEPYSSERAGGWGRTREARGNPQPPLNARSGGGSNPIDAVMHALEEVRTVNVRHIVTGELMHSLLFVRCFRHAAMRALLLPRQTRRRLPLWLQRLRAADLLEAVRCDSAHPLILEALREAFQEHLDLDGLSEVLERLERGDIHVVSLSRRTPSPFAAGFLQAFTGAFMYESDETRLERLSGSLPPDEERVAALLGNGQPASLLDPEAAAAVEAERQRTAPGWQARTVDELDDLLRTLGDLTSEEVAARVAGGPSQSEQYLRELVDRGRVRAVQFTPSGERYWLHTDLGVEPEERVTCFALQRGPFETAAVCLRYGLTAVEAEDLLSRLEAGGEVVCGPFSSAGVAWCPRETLAEIRRRTLRGLRQAVAPIDQGGFSRYLASRHGFQAGPDQGSDAVLEVLGSLEGLVLPIEVWERDIFRVRLPGYQPRRLDELIARGEVFWVAGGDPDGRARLAFFRRAHLPDWDGGDPVRDSGVDELGTVGARGLEDPLAEPGGADDRGPDGAPDGVGDSPAQAHTHVVEELLRRRGALFFADIVRAVGCTRGEALSALWRLMWQGRVTNDSFEAVRKSVAGVRPPEDDTLEDGSLPPGKGVPSRHDGLPQGRGASGFPTGIGGVPEFASRNGFVSRKRAARRAKRRVRERVDAEMSLGAGRWSLAPAAVRPLVRHWLDSESTTLPVHVSEICTSWWTQTLLRRYGLVSREIFQAEDLSTLWRSARTELDRAEWAGDVQRGYFVAGLSGPQFALAEAVEALNQMRMAGRGTAGLAEEDRERATVVSALDPVAVVGQGLLSRGEPENPRLGREPFNYAVFIAGEPCLSIEGYGRRLRPLCGEGDPRLPAAVAVFAQTLLRLPAAYRPRRKLVVEEWAGKPVGDTVGAELLSAVGFRPGGQGYACWPSDLRH